MFCMVDLLFDPMMWFVFALSMFLLELVLFNGRNMLNLGLGAITTGLYIVYFMPIDTLPKTDVPVAVSVILVFAISTLSHRVLLRKIF